MARRSLTSWPPPYPYQRVDAPDERAAWSRRAVRFLNSHGRWCSLCEARTWTLGPFTIRVRLEVHHCNGRGVYNPVGQEWDSELMVLCCRCHDRITVAHRRLGRHRGQIDRRGRTIDPVGYSHTIAEVTAAAHPLWVRRGIRRTLFGLPTKGAAVTRPRTHQPPT